MFDMLSIIDILAWGAGFIPQSAWARFFWIKLGFEAQQRKFLWPMQFDLHLNIVNCSFIIMPQKP
jgi:hypothetical protein